MRKEVELGVRESPLKQEAHGPGDGGKLGMSGVG